MSACGVLGFATLNPTCVRDAMTRCRHWHPQAGLIQMACALPPTKHRARPGAGDGAERAAPVFVARSEEVPFVEKQGAKENADDDMTEM